jgi:hypothetical protein
LPKVKTIFFKLANQKQELPVATMFVSGSGQNEHLHRGPSIDASYQVSLHLAEGFLLFTSPCQRQCELLPLPSLGIRRQLTFHICSSPCQRQRELFSSLGVRRMKRIFSHSETRIVHGSHVLLPDQNEK